MVHFIFSKMYEPQEALKKIKAKGDGVTSEKRRKEVLKQLLFALGLKLGK